MSIRRATAFALAAFLITGSTAALADSNPFTAITGMFKTTDKQKQAKKGTDAASGCIAWALLAKASNAQLGAACINGAAQNLAQERNEELADLNREEQKKRVAQEKNIAQMNREAADRQAQVLQLLAKEDTTHTDTVTRIKRWAAPESFPEVKEQITKLDTNISDSDDLVRDTRRQIDAKEQQLNGTTDVEARLILAREVGDLYAILKQAEYVKAANKDLKNDLAPGKPGLLASILGLFGAAGALVRGKIMDEIYKKTREVYAPKVVSSVKQRFGKKKGPSVYG